MASPKKKKILRDKLTKDIEKYGTKRAVALTRKFNPGLIPWVLNGGFSPTMWEAYDLENPPPRRRLCIEDPDKSLVEIVDWLCGELDLSRTQVEIYALSLIITHLEIGVKENLKETLIASLSLIIRHLEQMENTHDTTQK